MTDTRPPIADPPSDFTFTADEERAMQKAADMDREGRLMLQTAGAIQANCLLSRRNRFLAEMIAAEAVEKTE